MRTATVKTVSSLLAAVMMVTALGSCGDKNANNKSNSSSSGANTDVSSASDSNQTVSDNSQDSSISDPFDNSSSDSFDDSPIDLDFDNLFDFSASAEVKFNKSSSLDNYGGLSGVLPCYWFLPDSTLEDSYTQEEIDLSIKRMLQMGVSVVRTHNFQPGFAWDEKNNCWNWDSEYMTGFYKYADIMKQNNIDIIINTTEGFCSLSRVGEPIIPVNVEPPKTTLDSNGLTKEAIEYETACAKIYAQWCVDFVKEVIIKRGYSNIKYLMYATEPGSGFDNDKQQYAFELYLIYLKESDAALKSASLRNLVKFVGPNATSSPSKPTNGVSQKAKTWLELAVKYANDYLDIYSLHRYIQTNTFTEDYYDVWKEFVEYAKSVIKPTGKPYWFDEWNYTVDGGGAYTDTASSKLKATQIALGQLSMMCSGADSSIVWYLTDIKFPGSKRNSSTGETYVEGIHMAGLQPSVLRSVIPYPSWYVYCMLGSAIRAGDTVYSSTSDYGIHSMLLKHKDGTVSIVTVSMEMLDTEAEYTLPFNLGNKTFTRTVYNPYTFVADTTGTPIAPTSTVKIGKTLKDNIGAYQVVVYNQK